MGFVAKAAGTLVVGAVCAAGGAAGALHWKERQERAQLAEPAEGSAPAPVTRTHLVAFARMEPSTGVISVAAAEADRLASIAVEEGQVVEAGAELARLDAHTVRRAEVRKLEILLQEAEARFAAETAYHQAQIAAAELAIREAKLQLHEVDMEQAGVAQAKSRRDHALAELERLTGLREGGGISQQQVAAARNDLEVAEVSLKKAELLAAQRARLADAAVAKAEAQLETQRALLLRSQASIARESLRSELVSAKERLARTIVRAPVQGTVLKILASPGESSRVTLLHMGDVTRMHAVAEVYETDIQLVRTGQRVVVSSSALPEDLSGEVIQVGALIFKNDIFGDDPTAPTDARVFQVRIALEKNAWASRFTNHEVRARIALGESP